MPDIDIPIPDELREALAAPKCVNLDPPKPLKLTLPSGGALSVPADLGSNIPNDCSVSFSMMLQLQPILASMDCILKILKLLKPLSDAVTSPPPTPALVKDIVNAVADLAPCFLMVTPAGILPFIRDILCLILRLLRCLIGQVKTMIGIMSGLTIEIDKAKAGGNDELVASLECAQGNALTSAGELLKALDPIISLLDMMAPIMAIGGIDAIKMPALGDDASVEGMQTMVTTLETVVDTIQGVVDAIGGCPS
ncbi:MAG: hypothetical protein KZQ95_11810 [Candidatus Thiodiazotropha sp. (ex Epidulcina cf. delphinae)]|nr:hypothetical protein [Candidatus Thiodiazotropha sp. (ex Epidulcina cf. delphinae)]